MADYRYLQAWAKPASSSSSSNRRGAAVGGGYDVHLPVTQTDTSSTSSSYQVRLDTPGGITYAPDITNPHNSAKRLFIPAKLIETDTYDYAAEIEQRRQKQKEEKERLRKAKGGELNEDGQTDAQAYAANAREGQVKSNDDVKREAYEVEEGEKDSSDTATIKTNATVRSVQSKMTTMTLTAEKDKGLPSMVSQYATAANFRAPPSIAGDKSQSKTPWNASTWTGHRAFDRPSEKERQAGITNYEDVGGEGRIPSAAEADLEPLLPDGASLKTTRTARGQNVLRVEDLFIPDPRSWRPLRYVRKVDPRQMLLLCAGTTMSAGEVAANQLGDDRSSILSGSAQSMRKSMLNYGKLPDYSTLASALSSTPPAGGIRAGLGFVYCPSFDHRATLDPMHSFRDDVSVAYGGGSRTEPNFSRRLERTPEFALTTKRRAGLRSVVAALEYNKWEEEGFDKIVVATHHRWIVDGIARDIWEWRHNNWRLMRESLLGGPGENVPDRDLWELLDRVVCEYEKIDCTVRFWYISRSNNKQAVQLAEEGCLKDNQQPSTVRWTKKKAGGKDGSDRNYLSGKS